MAFNCGSQSIQIQFPNPLPSSCGVTDTFLTLLLQSWLDRSFAAVSAPPQPTSNHHCTRVDKVPASVEGLFCRAKKLTGSFRDLWK